MIDAELCEEGVEECLQSEVRTKIAQHEIACVVVSPMRRAMQTAYYLLKDREDFASIQFIVNPLCRELLGAAADVPSARSDMIRYAQSLFPTVDTSSCFEGYENPEHYFVEDFTVDVEARNTLTRIIKRNPDQPVTESAFTAANSRLQAGRYLESSSNMADRATRFREFLQSLYGSVEVS